jgi:sugar lactone lactonase YvrE
MLTSIRPTVAELTLCTAVALGAQTPQTPTAPIGKNAMSNPFRMVENWPTMPPDLKWGAVIGIVPTGDGGAWIHQRADPPIVRFDPSGKIVKTFGNGLFVQAHGFCRDRDGNFWAGDGGAFVATTGEDIPEAKGRGFQFFKFSPEGKMLVTLGKAGVSKAGPDTFISPTACAVAPNGDVVIADGHIPRGASTQRDGDRIVRFTKDGKFVNAWGKQGTGPGEFTGPHAVAFDSQERLFVADRSNNRIQIFDKDMNFVDEWRHFGRPSGIAIMKDDTLIVADSESGKLIVGFDGRVPRNPGWKQGIRIGSAKDGSLKYFVDGTDPEGMAADEVGNIFAGLTGRAVLQKWVRK